MKRVIFAFLALFSFSATQVLASHEDTINIARKMGAMKIEMLFCESENEMERFIQTRFRYQTWPEEVITNIINLLAGRRVCTTEELVISRPRVVKKIHRHLTDVWIYRVETRKGIRYTALRERNTFRNI